LAMRILANTVGIGRSEPPRMPEAARPVYHFGSVPPDPP
jgi:hypothetical protein